MAIKTDLAILRILGFLSNIFAKKKKNWHVLYERLLNSTFVTTTVQSHADVNYNAEYFKPPGIESKMRHIFKY